MSDTFFFYANAAWASICVAAYARGGHALWLAAATLSALVALRIGGAA